MTGTLIGSTIAVCIIIFSLAIPKSWLRKIGPIQIGSVRPFSPNWITAWSMVITWLGLWIYHHSPLWGITVCTIGAILDRLDGRMAMSLGQSYPPPSEWQSHHSFREEFNFPGKTHWGTIWDPMGDKLKAFPALFYFVYIGVISLWLVSILMLIELIGTLIRRPFHLLQQYVQQSRATAVGKWKNVLIWVLIPFCAFSQHDVLPKWFWVHWLSPLNGMTVLTVILAALSLGSKLWPGYKKTAGSFESSLDHE